MAQWNKLFVLLAIAMFHPIIAFPIVWQEMEKGQGMDK